jgi:hypothetical protein
VTLRAHRSWGVATQGQVAIAALGLAAAGACLPGCLLLRWLSAAEFEQT